MEQLLSIRVFLSSPGDVTEERQIALEVIERLPNRPAFREKVAFRIIAWDKPGAGTPMRATLTPQEAINKGLPRPSECDIVIVIFWSRMGTPLTLEDKEYLSGTHWELMDALEAERPQTVIYRRTQKKLFESDDTQGQEQFKRVEAFFKSDLFYESGTGEIRRGLNFYKSPDDFRQQFETHFEALVVELLQRPPIEAPPETVPENTQNITTITTTPWVGSPFPGLRAFTPADAPIYFGRGQETDSLVQRVTEGRLVAVVGASGSGKSSLVGAGLLPRLKANAIAGSKDWLLPDWKPEIHQWIGLRFAPGEVGDNPFMAFALKLASLTGYTPRDLAERLLENPAALTEICTQLLKDKPDWAEVLIFIDQFEELFTLVHPQYIALFVDLLQMATNSQRLRTILTLRADFYARCVEAPKLAAILETTTFPLAAPISVELYQMITRPAEQAGLEFEEGLPERILEDTGDEPGALALMAYTLDELYHSGGGDYLLATPEYEALGGVQGAIGKRAETVFAALDIEAQDALVTVFREIVEVDERGEPTRRRAELAVVAPDAAAKRLVEALTGARARLLVQDKDAQGHPIVEVAHEALLRQWPRLKGWIEQEQNNLRLRRQIQQTAQEWEAHGRAEGYLLMGSRLEDAARWLKAFPAGQLEQDFIASSAEADRQRKAEERKIAQRVQNFQRISLVLTLVLAAGLALFGISALGQNRQSQSALATVQWQGTLDGFQLSLRRTQVAGATLVVEQTRVPETVVALMTRMPELDAWTPSPQAFDGVEMVQVPPGCFLMGGTADGDELPLHEQCFDEPFWIDRYEVTNEQFGDLQGVANNATAWSGDKQPRTNIGWAEARDFCDARDGNMDDGQWDGVRLPMEAEWQYAARGPNSLIYPWGNEFRGENVVYPGSDNPASEPADVGSKPGGVSWVGADDLSGNVWEWTSTIYDQTLFPYPYNRDDGREEPDSNYYPHVLLGGSFKDSGFSGRAADRYYAVDIINGQDWVGFRCARSQ